MQTEYLRQHLGRALPHKKDKLDEVSLKDFSTNLATWIRNAQIKYGQTGDEGDLPPTVSQVSAVPEIEDERKDDGNDEVEEHH